ncbi:hypothetical protein C8R47DRAFT_1288720, partial [Mycena vitilis]
LLFILFLLLPLFFKVGSALLNVTIDDTSPLLTYKGKWEPSSTHLSGLDYGGSHTVSGDAKAGATFTFTGVAVFYVAPRWPYTVNTQLSLDGAPPVVVDLTDPIASKTAPGGSESAPFSVAWSQEGLSNTTHTLALTMASTGQFIIADGFMCVSFFDSACPADIVLPIAQILCGQRLLALLALLVICASTNLNELNHTIRDLHQIRRHKLRRPSRPSQD